MSTVAMTTKMTMGNDHDMVRVQVLGVVMQLSTVHRALIH